MIYCPHFDSFRFPLSVSTAWAASFPRLRNIFNEVVGKKFSLSRILAQKIINGKDDTFIFITTTTQEKYFDAFIESYGLKDLIVFQSPYITNINYPDHGRRLRITILQTKEHYQRESENAIGKQTRS